MSKINLIALLCSVGFTTSPNLARFTNIKLLDFEMVKEDNDSDMKEQNLFRIHSSGFKTKNQ